LSSTLAAAIVAAIGSTISPIIVVWVSKQINTVHHLVDGTKTTLENRIAQLEDIITTSNKEIPPTTRETGR